MCCPAEDVHRCSSRACSRGAKTLYKSLSLITPFHSFFPPCEKSHHGVIVILLCTAQCQALHHLGLSSSSVVAASYVNSTERRRLARHW